MHHQNGKLVIVTRKPETLAKVAQLVERNLAKVEVASSNLVFRSESFPQRKDFSFKIKAKHFAEVVELVDTQDLKSCSP